MRISHLKDRCVACERSRKDLQDLGIKFNKEHLSPGWLIKMTGTDKTYIRWLGRKVHGLSATIPLCEECNSDFGNEIETLVAQIFRDLEAGKGITDYEAELLVRWMWKFEGMLWHLLNEKGVYSDVYTLKERVLSDLDSIRPHLTLAIAKISDIDPSHGDKPMGIDSINHRSAIFVSGVFSKLAIMVSHREFDDFIPRKFSIYHLKDIADNKAKVFFPDTYFEDDNKAVYVTYTASPLLSALHDGYHQFLEDASSKLNSKETFIEGWLRRSKIMHKNIKKG